MSILFDKRLRNVKRRSSLILASLTVRRLEQQYFFRQINRDRDEDVMKYIYRIASLIEWTAVSYFAIPESIFKASRIQCEEWMSEVEASLTQINTNTPCISFSPITPPASRPIINFLKTIKLTLR